MKKNSFELFFVYDVFLSLIHFSLKMLLCFVIAGLLLRENTTAGAEEKLVFVTFLLFSCRSVVFISTCFMRFKRVFIVFWMVCFNKELVQREVFLTDPFKR